ncbi:hypothetical protein GJAV_G00045490 [Gymnothorax javanicus]|nr:hypothetical protein GJAV_G00045490 [Gymnothorax javanicus]
MDFSSEHGDSIDLPESVTLPRDQSISDAAVDDVELESLRISLKKMAPDQATKPKLQCVMMDPSFSMVTVQNENSGIVWEKAPNRCLSLWASDASNISEGHSTPVCGGAGKIIFIMDEDKIRRRKKSGGKLDEELKRLSPRPAVPEQLKGAEERPAVTPVSVPDVQPQGISEERELSGHKEQKEQDVCCMVCEGSEELNIIFPSRLPTVQEEESCEMAEKLSYLEQTKMDTSYPMSEEKDSHVMNVSGEAKVKEEPCSTDKEPVQPDATHCPPVSKPVIRDEITDTDYLAKFALLDETPQPNLPKVEVMPTNANEEAKATENQDWSVSTDPGVFTLSGDIAGSHSENMSFGSRCLDEPDDRAGNENLTEEKDKHDRKEEVLKSPLMEGGSAFSGSEEMILTPIVLPPGPSKIITPSLQEEPRAIPFPYTELCEEAVGDQNEVEDCTDTESTVPERILQQRQPDAKEASGYSEKCILKGETPVVENETINGGVRMQLESTLELTGCKTGVKGKDNEENKITEQIIENYSVQHEENCETVTAKNTGLEEEMFQSPDVVRENTLSEVHIGHDVSTLDKACADIKDKLSQWISVLQGKSEKIEDLVSELEQAYNLLENNCESNAQSLVEQHEEMVKAVVKQYDEMCHSMAEKKRLRLGQLESQIGTFQKRIQFAKETVERESVVVQKPDPFVFVSSSKGINKSLCRALESLEPVQGNITIGTECCGETPLKDILVPQEPCLLVQEASSATCTSVTVFWRVSEEDVINCFQVNWVEEFQGDIPAVSEVSRVTVKESCCTLEELAPDRCYKVWVIAVNYAGCSLPSEKLPFRTAPSIPEIIPEQCTVCWDTAVIRWSSVSPAAPESFTLQYCRQNPCEGEGLRSISGIKDYAQRVFLQPNENYLFYISAVNFAGASGQSEAVLISTSGTKIHLLKDTASPGLVLCKDNTVRYPAEAFSTNTELDECQTILAELLPPRGLHYWETTVEGSEGFRIGVAYHTTPRNTRLGENSTSWCIHCIPSSSSQQYKLLHSGSQTSVITVEVPTRIGTLLDYNHECLSFFNAQSGQLLGTCCHRFSEPCHPVLVLERPGTLALNPVVEVPDFVKRC